jgi:hypothetical protein
LSFILLAIIVTLSVAVHWHAGMVAMSWLVIIYMYPEMSTKYASQTFTYATHHSVLRSCRQKIVVWTAPKRAPHRKHGKNNTEKDVLERQPFFSKPK